MLPRDRAVRRRRGFGRFGIGTSRLVGQHRGSLRADCTCAGGLALASGTSLAIVPAHIAGHIQRGGGTGPLKPRQPFRSVTRAGTVPIPVRCGRGRVPNLRHKFQHGGGFFMSAEALRCKECGADYPLDARYVCERCFGPLEVRYGAPARFAKVDEVRRRIQGGPQNIWRYARLPAARGRPARPAGRASSRTGLPAGCTPLIRADRLAERLGLGEVWVKNDAANPTHSFKDRVVSVARRPRARARLRGARLRLDRQPRELRRRPRRGARAGVLRLHPVRPRGAEGPRDRRLRHEPRRRSAATTTTSTASAPSSRASATGRSSTSTCARTTPRAPRRSPTRSPSSSAGRCPTASSRRSPPARCSRRSHAASRSGSSSG